MEMPEILSAFAEEGTLAAVAERLHISQPTLSSAMKKLEEEIGAPLFERTRNRMALNEDEGHDIAVLCSFNPPFRR